MVKIKPNIKHWDIDKVWSYLSNNMPLVDKIYLFLGNTGYIKWTLKKSINTDNDFIYAYRDDNKVFALLEIIDINSISFNLSGYLYTNEDSPKHNGYFILFKFDINYLNKLAKVFHGARNLIPVYCGNGENTIPHIYNLKLL
jgi:hypothetical protein